MAATERLSKKPLTITRRRAKCDIARKRGTDVKIIRDDYYTGNLLRSVVGWMISSLNALGPCVAMHSIFLVGKSELLRMCCMKNPHGTATFTVHQGLSRQFHTVKRKKYPKSTWLKHFTSNVCTELSSFMVRWSSTKLRVFHAPAHGVNIFAIKQMDFGTDFSSNITDCGFTFHGATLFGGMSGCTVRCSNVSSLTIWWMELYYSYHVGLVKHRLPVQFHKQQ